MALNMNISSGLGFRDRNTAFDFRSRVIDFYERN